MKRGDWTGIKGIPAQDMAMWESMGPITDRSEEHFGSSDLAVAQFRRMMVAAAKTVQRRRARDRHRGAARRAREPRLVRGRRSENHGLADARRPGRGAGHVEVGRRNKGGDMRRTVIAFVLACAASGAAAQAWPTKPVRLVSQFPPGGGTDLIARNLMPSLIEAFGQNFILEHRPGAAGNIAADYVAKSAADGYVILIANNTIVIQAAMPQSAALRPGA